MDIVRWIILALCAVLAGGIFIGQQRNQRLRLMAANWLRTGLNTYDKAAVARSTVPTQLNIHLEVNKKNAPFSELNVDLQLKQRTNPVMYTLQWLRGEHDTVWITANLRSPVPLELHAIPVNHTELLDELKSGKTFAVREEYQGYRLMGHGAQAATTLQAVKALLTEQPGCIQRISIQPQSPQLSVQANLQPLMGLPAVQFFETLGNLLH